MTPDADGPAAFAEDAARGTATAGAAAGAPELRLGAWEGPLDLLLELARAQRVDLAQLSISALAGQFAAALDAALAARRVPLSRLAEWVVMAAWLTALRARLLLPVDARERDEAELEAAGLRRRLAEREAAGRLADWLEWRLRLGRDVFGRGVAEPALATEPAADVAELLRACLRLLELPVRERAWRPGPPPLWRVPDALARIRRLLPGLPEAAPLARFLPEAGQGGRSPLQRRAALASTLMAGLELARDGAAALRQDEPFGEVRLGPAAAGPAERVVAAA